MGDFNSSLGQNISHSCGTQDKSTLDARAHHEIRGHAARSEHLVVFDLEADASQSPRLCGRPKSAAVGQHDKRNGAAPKSAEHLDGAGQNFIAAEAAVAEQ